MKRQVYVVSTSMLNGSVTMFTHSDIFLDKSVAEKARSKIIELNKNSDFPVVTRIEESTLFELEEDVPCLNGEENDN